MEKRANTNDDRWQWCFVFARFSKLLTASPNCSECGCAPMYLADPGIWWVMERDPPATSARTVFTPRAQCGLGYLGAKGGPRGSGHPPRPPEISGQIQLFVPQRLYLPEITHVPEYPPSVIGVGGRGCGGGGAGGLAARLAGGLGLPRRPPQPLPSPAPALLSPSPAQPQCCGHWPGPQPAGRAARAPMGPKVLQGALWS